MGTCELGVLSSFPDTANQEQREHRGIGRRFEQRRKRRRRSGYNATVLQQCLLADRSLESGCCSEDSSDGELNLSSGVPSLGFFFFFFFRGLEYDDRVRPLTVSPLQSEVCFEPRQQASPSRLRALQLARKDKGRTTSGNC